jgi:phosphate-selective porin OprO/OprP
MTLFRVAGVIVGGGIFAALSFQNALAQATTPEGRLKILQDQINSLQQQLEQLKNTTDQKFESDPIVTFPNNRPTIGNKNASLAIGAQIQFDMGGYFQDSNSNDIIPAGARELNTGSNLRRARMFLVGKYYDWTVNFAPDFGGSPDGAVSLYEANLNYTMKPVTMTIGMFKPWYSLQDSMSSNDFLFMERPSIIEIARNVAAGDARASLGAKANGEQWFASGYLTGGNWGDQQAALANEEQLAVVGRLAGRPLYGDDWNLHVGFSGSYMFQPPQSNVDQPGDSAHNTQLRDRPELRIDMNRLIDTGVIDTDTADTWGFELGGSWRNFMVQGEYVRIDVDRRFDDTLHFQGGYVEGSWVITGEQRKYNAGNAAFARPVPANPFDPIKGERGWGAWELAARYSVTDLNDDNVNGGNQQVYGLSLSWYPNALVRFLLQGDYVDVDRQNAAGTTEIGQDFWDVALRSQIAF